jgi:geranylgeranyl diphosphate synthase type I
MTPSKPPADSLPVAVAALERYRPAILEELRNAFQGRDAAPFNLMRYHLGWEDREGRPTSARGGKLLRPSLCLLCCEATGGDWTAALPAAAAIELLHNFTLIHDDVEDGSRLRHGRDTVWSVWGEAQAINAGDGMFALAHRRLLLLDEEGFQPMRLLEAIRVFDEAALSLTEGQHRDLSAAEDGHERLEEYVAMIAGKTAALLSASCGMGALLGGADAMAVEAYETYGRHLGLAFQTRDDYLGVWGEPSETGKAASDDLRTGKRSYPVVAALERAAPEEAQRLRALIGTSAAGAVDEARLLLESLGAREAVERAAREHAEAAVASLATIGVPTPYRAELEQLARFAAERSS